tara:strand:+ start:291 stop:446 length:156 start_codon:yes stop_codon:yes gene_type:complete
MLNLGNKKLTKEDLENWNNGKERNHSLIFGGGHEEMIEKYGENGEYFERKK